MAAFLALSLAACAPTTPAEPTGAPGASDGGGESDVRVAFVSQIEGIPVFDAFNQGASAEADRLGITSPRMW
ncbi:hypothetical protein V5H98_12965 [Georgenia sp. M64]|uniref:hypothetical protein n=1 Tax=Georgenia sp. M64 TaxID=3120520 RepID=UPI0030E4A9F0